jgi:PAS domain-containing protein
MPFLLADSTGSLPWQCLAAVIATALVASILCARRSKRLLRGQLDLRLRNEAWLRMTLAQMPAVVWTTDTELVFTSCAGAGMVGLPDLPPTMVGLSFYDYFKTTDPTFLPIARHLQALAGESCNYEMDWNRHTFLVRCEPLRDADGKIIGAIGVGSDISSRKAAEQALADSEAKTLALLTAIPDVMFRLDRDGRLLEFIDKLLAPSEDYVGRNIRDIVPAAVAAQFLDAARLALRDQTTQNFEYTTGTAKHRRHYEARVVTCHGDDVLVIVRNVTPWRQAAAERRPGLLSA